MRFLKVGDRVRMINGKLHKQMPEYYPAWGTEGTVTEVQPNGDILVEWPENSTSGNNEWYSDSRDIEVVAT